MTDRILFVEDDERLGAQVKGELEREGFEVHWEQDGDRAREIDPTRFQMIVLDLMLPGTYGMDLLKRFRKRSDVPVLILSARDDTSDKVRALKLGADDYVTKPFWPEELVARVLARLRRPQLRRGEVVRAAGLTIDLGARTVTGSAGAIELTKVEFEILATLARRPGAAVTRAALVDAALDPERLGNERTLDVHVSRLRKKLGAAGKAIATVWGIGYRLDPDAGQTP